MASIRKRNLLGLIILTTSVICRIILYYLESDHGLALISPVLYDIIDYTIILSPLIFIYNSKVIRNVIYMVVGILVIVSTISVVNYSKNTERIFYNSKTKKDKVIIEISNRDIGSEIYVYERKYIIFSTIKDIMYNGQGEVAFNTKMKVQWINDHLLSITYQDDCQVIEKIIDFNPAEKRYKNVMDSIMGLWKAKDGRELDVGENNIVYKVGNHEYAYSSEYCDEQNNYATVLYGNYSKPSITIIKESNGDIAIRKVSLTDTKWTQYKTA